MKGEIPPFADELVVIRELLCQGFLTTMPHLIEAVQHHLYFSTLNMYQLLDLVRLKTYHCLDFLLLLLIDDTF